VIHPGDIVELHENVRKMLAEYNQFFVFPGDIVVGDEDGVVVIPRHLADKVATSGLEQEQVEAYIKRRVELGEPIAGFYPASERTMADYAAWIAAGRPKLG
jgi:hypothetical protein